MICCKRLPTGSYSYAYASPLTVGRPGQPVQIIIGVADDPVDRQVEAGGAGEPLALDQTEAGRQVGGVGG